MSAVTLIVAEKPSMARDIARVIGARAKQSGYLAGDRVWVSWCIGHLAELCEPHEYDPKWKSWSPSLLPILPERFRIRPSRAGAAHLRRLHGLMRAREVGAIVNACDAGREGELIFRYVYELSGCHKPVRRLWLSSLTSEAIRRGMAALRPGADYDRLADAARCRAEADWLVGMNATRALTGLARRGGGRGVLLSVGRVQTPTLALIVRREQDIEGFVSEPYWQVRATFTTPAASPAEASTYDGLWHRPGEAASAGGSSPATTPGRSATWHRPREAAPAGGAASGRPARGDDDKQAKATRLATREEADAIAAAVSGRDGRVAAVERKRERERPPLLFDLTNLQKAANRRYRMSAKRTLAAAQALYESHKAITYPRTDSRHLPADIAPELPAVLAALPPPYRELGERARARGVPSGKRMIDDAKVGDHHALIPTAAAPTLDALGADERHVYDLIARRFLAGFLPDAVYEKTRIETLVDEHRFVSTGRVRVDAGWQEAEPPSPKARERERLLPRVDEGGAVHTDPVEVLEGHTQPPKRYSEGTLLGAMEHAGRGVEDAALKRTLEEAGLGTPATRAAIIETLLTRRYIERRGNELHPTAAGRALIAAVPSDELLSAELTGVWEQKLAAIARGQGSRARFMDDIRGFTARLVETCAAATPPAIEAPPAETLGRCPVCGTAVSEGFKAYQCATGRECSFVIFKRVAGRKISPALVRVLLGRGRSQVLKGFRSKRGKRFSAALELDADGTVRFAFDGRADRAGAAPDQGASERGGGRRARSKAASSRAATSSKRTSPIPEASSASKPSRSRARAGDRRSAETPEAASASKSSRPTPTGAPRCPACRQGRIISGRRAWGCSRWRESCRFVVPFVHAGLHLPEDEAERLFRRGQTRLMEGLSDQGKARLVLDLEQPDNVRVELGKRGRRTPPT